jgi:hypothetical protein
MAVSQNYGNQSAYPPPGGQYDQHHDSSHKDKGHGNMMGAAAGGLAVGAVGGALAGHAMGMPLLLTLPTSTINLS